MSAEEYKYEQGMRYKLEPLAKDAGEVRELHEANRIGWNEAAIYYEEHLNEAIEFIRAGKSSLHPIERDNLGDLSDWCDTAIHLQCASGRDTLSLWNEGVKRVIGVDISDAHIANARREQSRGRARCVVSLRRSGHATRAGWHCGSCVHR